MLAAHTKLFSQFQYKLSKNSLYVTICIIIVNDQVEINQNPESNPSSVVAVNPAILGKKKQIAPCQKASRTHIQNLLKVK